MKSIVSILFITFLTTTCFAQPNTEIGASGGMLYYIGDLNRTGHLNPDLMNPGGSFFIRSNFDGRWSWKNQILAGSVVGDDALSANLWQQQRNLSFSSPIYEFSSVFEFNFFEYRNFNVDDKFTPYIYGGVSVFYMEPQTTLNGNQYDLRSLLTEGQTEPYNRVNVAMPFGVGVKFRLLERLSIFAEYGMRKTTTDYLDDVSTFYPDPTTVSPLTASLSNRSTNQLEAFNNNWQTQRGDSETDDWFSYIGAGLSFRLTKDPSSCHFTPFY